MRIGINILYLIPGKVGGTETYARNLIPTLSNELNEDDSLIIFASRETAPTFKSSGKIKVITLPFYAQNRIARLFFEQTLLPLYCLKYKIDVLFSLGYSQPIFLPCKSSVTIHDLNWYYHPEDFSLASRLMWNILTRLSAISTNHVITDSEYSLNSIKQVLKVNASKVTSILHGVPPKFSLSKSKKDYKYIFTVVAGHPHKNLITLIKAFNQISLHFPKLKLLIAGLGGKADSGIKEYISSNNLQNKVKILGYVDNRELASLYSAAEVFVFPSAYEGFGYPVLEAMSYGTPVISSSATSLREVVGEGGMLVSSYDILGYAQAVKDLLLNGNLRNKYIRLGKKRAEELNWHSTANKTINVLHKITEEHE